MSIRTPLAALAGALTWTAAEYALHRFLGHGPKRKAPGPRWAGLRDAARLGPVKRTIDALTAEFYREHTAHHVDPMYFAPMDRKLAAAVVTVAGLGALGTAFVGPRRAFAFGLGFSSAYIAYEVLHRRVHTHAPRGAYSRWRRKSHWLHHRAPKSNHGVTSPVWDRVMGTYMPPTQVPLGRAIAPAWLVDARGEVHPALAADYVLVGPPRPEPTPPGCVAAK